MAYIPHDQPTLDMFLELLNTVSSRELTLDNVTISSPSPIDPVGIRNTSVQVDAIPGEGFSNTVTTRHRRLDLGEYLNPLAVSLSLPENAVTTHDGLTAFNGRFGTGIGPSDVEDLPIVGNDITFRFTDNCLAYIGEVECNAVYVGVDERTSLNDAVDGPIVLDEFYDPNGDYDNSPVELLRLMIQATQGIVLPADKYILSVPKENTEGTYPGNTKITLYSTPDSFYSGSVDVYYNRVDWGSFFPQGVEFEHAEQSMPVNELLGFVNPVIGFQVGDYDVVGGSFTTGGTIEASDKGVLLEPGSELLVNITLPPVSMVCPYLFSLDDNALYFGVSAVDFTTRDYNGDTLELTAAQPVAGYLADYATVAEADFDNLEQQHLGNISEGDIFTTIPLDGTQIIGFEVEASNLGSIVAAKSTYSYSFGVVVAASYVTDAVDVHRFQFQDGLHIVLDQEATGTAAGSVVKRTAVTAEAIGETPQSISAEFFANKSIKYPGIGDKGRIGFYYNQQTKQMGVVSSLHGDLGYLPGYDNGGFLGKTPYEVLSENGSETFSFIVNGAVGAVDNANDTAGEMELKVHSKTSGFEMPYPAGTIDTCLNPISRAMVQYPLLASESDIIGAGLTGKLIPSLADQAGSLVVGGENRQTVPGLYLMLRDTPGGTPTTDFTSFTSWVGVEFEFKAPSLFLSGSSESPAYSLGASLSDESTTSGVFIELHVYGDDSKKLVVGRQGQDSFSDEYPISGGGEFFRVGVKLDVDTGQIQIWLNSEEIALSNDVVGVPTEGGALLAAELHNIPAAGDEAVSFVRLISDPYWMITPFPTGGLAIDGVTPIVPNPTDLEAHVIDTDLDGLTVNE